MLTNKTMTALFLTASLVLGTVSGVVLAQEESLSHLHQEEGNEAHKAYPTTVVDINTASLDELKSLKGVGPKRAEAIVAERANGPFKTVEDLSRVKGLSVKIVQKLMAQNSGKIKAEGGN